MPSVTSSAVLSSVMTIVAIIDIDRRPVDDPSRPAA
jgi:hypothetical protein